LQASWGYLIASRIDLAAASAAFATVFPLSLALTAITSRHQRTEQSNSIRGGKKPPLSPSRIIGLSALSSVSVALSLFLLWLTFWAIDQKIDMSFDLEAAVVGVACGLIAGSAVVLGIRRSVG
jgi:hypothetical protein